MHPPAYPPRPPQHHAQANGVASPFKAVVDELLHFNSRHLAAYASNHEEHERQKFLLNAVMEYVSAYFHGSAPSDDIRARVTSNAEATRGIFDQLVPLFRKHQGGLVVPSPFEEDSGVRKVESEEGDAGTNSVAQRAASTDSANPLPAIPGLAVSGAAQSSEAEATPAAASAPADVAGTTAQYSPPQLRGTKRDAVDVADSEPDAKRPKSGEA